MLPSATARHEEYETIPAAQSAGPTRLDLAVALAGVGAARFLPAYWRRCQKGSRGQGMRERYPDLMVGTRHRDDAAGYRLNDDQAIVATTDFFLTSSMILDVGRIAATNALSDIYAIGRFGRCPLASGRNMPHQHALARSYSRIARRRGHVARKRVFPSRAGHSTTRWNRFQGLCVTAWSIEASEVKRNSGRAAIVGGWVSHWGWGIF